MGSADDPEDGDLTTSLEWTSSIDNVIGTGGSFPTTLSDGNHFITAEVTDPDGKSGSDSVSITVGSGGVCDLGKAGDPCTNNGDSCSNKCKGKSGSKTCKGE